MFCKYCGRQIADGSLFCPGCGNRLDSAQEQTPPAQQTPPSQPGSYPNYTPTTPPPAGGYRPNGGYQSPNNAANFSGYPMGWYKFLIYFALFASCVLNALSAIGMLYSTPSAPSVCSPVCFTTVPAIWCTPSSAACSS